MPEYREILEFLAKNPPQFDSERALHASLLELLANCLRSDQKALVTPQDADEDARELAKRIEESHIRWVNFS